MRRRLHVSELAGLSAHLTAEGPESPSAAARGCMAYPLAYREHTFYATCRRDGHTRWADALPAHTTHRVLAARGTWAPGPAGQRQGATGVRVGVARPVDGPRETALGLRLRTVKCRSRRRKQLRGSGSASPACMRGSLKGIRVPITVSRYQTPLERSTASWAVGMMIRGAPPRAEDCASRPRRQ